MALGVLSKLAQALRRSKINKRGTVLVLITLS